jgi:signal transduction histidine kinase/ActR/RegA family two-component response regulator
MIAPASERALVFAPRGRDAELTCTLLAKHGIEVTRCATARDLVAGIRDGAGCAIVTSEVLDRELHGELHAWLAAQPPWSDFPVIVLTRGTGAARDTGFDLGNMTILERPVTPPTLLVAVRASLRGRRRQYDAQAAIHQRDQFLAMLGHELRNPLGAIVLAAEPLGTEQASPAVMTRRLALIDRQANHLTRLVNDLLDVARVTSGKLQLRREGVDLDAAIRDCIEAIVPCAREREIGFVMELASGTTIEGDAGRLEQVIGNLLANAIKYSPPGRTITVCSARAGNGCEIRVRDQGVGIAADMLPRVFDLFTQADASLDRSEGGLGIGLALVERLVRLHLGTVSVSSAGLGKGSEFVVWLPLGDPPATAAAAPQPAVELDRPLRVVIVEDNRDLLELTQAVVESLGCATEIAVDGEEGLERIFATHPDLALVDVGLPKLDGYELARRVKQQLVAPPTLVAVTGYGQRGDRTRALAAGFDDHITKPLRTEALQALIEATRTRLAPFTRRSERGRDGSVS